tara:strand:- start:1449 stop:2723 length:1275 start_codon:yes stop_codon:yes gene_type:complete
MLKKNKNLGLYFGITALIFSPQVLYAGDISIANQVVHETSITQNDNLDEVDVVKSESLLKSDIYGEFNQIGFKIDVRFRYDLENEIDSRQSEIQFREAFVDLETQEIYWRLGKQTIVWGASDGLRLLDVINPLNYREFILDDFDNSRISLTSASADIPISDGSSLTVIVIPELKFNQYAKTGTQFELSHPLPELSQMATSLQVNSAKEPQQSLHNSELALRYATFASGWDITFNYFYHYQDDPVVFIDIDGGAVSVNQEYKRNTLIGGTANNAFGDFVLRTEFVLNNSRYYSTDNPDQRFINKAQELQYVIGLDYSGISDTLISGQWFRRQLLSYEQDITEDAVENTLTLLLRRYYANETIILEALALHSLDNSDGLVRPKVKYELSTFVQLELGADIFYGVHRGFFGQFAAKDQITLGINIGF